MKTISCSMKPLKFHQYKRRKGHDMREQKQVPGNIDQTKTCHNTVVIPTPTAKEALEMMRQVKGAANARQRFDPARNNLVYDGILSFSHEAQGVVHALDVQEQVRRIVESIREVCKLHKGRLIGLTIHRDEYAIHAHFQVLAAGEDGRMLRIGPRDCRQRQDVAVRAWGDLGIARGKPKRQRIENRDLWSKIIKRSVRQLHEDLPREIAHMETQNAALREENERLTQEVWRVHVQYQDILKHLGVAQEVLAAEEGILIDQNTNEDEPRPTMGHTLT